MKTTSQTEILFLNQASILVKHGGEYLLTDPWYQRPAFGSWLPNPPLAIHPAYLMALSDHLRILISHGHDDHFDDNFLSLFEPHTPIFSANYSSPGVRRRVEKAGMGNFTAVDREGLRTGPFTIKSFIHADVSLDDAIYTIETPDSLIVHSNDNWRKLPPDIFESIHADVARIGGSRSIYMTQTNSASGYPLNYVDYSDAEKKRLLHDKVFTMVATGFGNASKLGVKYVLSYAGFASVFVNGHPEYYDLALFPTAKFISENLSEAIPEGVQLVDLLPGDQFDFYSIHKSFVNSGIEEAKLSASTKRFYEQYGLVDECDTYTDLALEIEVEELRAKLTTFLSHFNEFVVRKVHETGFESSILGKALTIDVVDLPVTMSVDFGQGITEHRRPNKTILVESHVLNKVLDGVVWFENLYTGYEAQFSRSPRDIYNRDIVMYIVMFSYHYRNSVVADLVKQH